MATVEPEQLEAMLAAKPEPAEPEPLGREARELIPCADAFDFAQLYFPEHELYRWQIEALLQLSGYPDPYNPDVRVQPTKEAPLRYTLCAANGSGKDQIVLAIWSLWCICCRPDFYWIGTSSSAEQLENQTWHHIKMKAQAINKVHGPRFLRINKFKIQCPKSGSILKLFRSDEEKLTEGFHPLVEGGEMVIALNECKSLDESVIMAFRRCHGATHWLNISSPGDPIGHFYESCQKPDFVWPQPYTLGKKYFRRVTVNDCPHLKAEFERALEEFEITSPFIRSSFLAEFTETGLLLIVPPERLVYPYPAKTTLGLPRRAGLDLSGGGDATILSVWEGNYLVGEFEFYERHEPTLTRTLCAKIEEMGIPASHVYADGGSMGSAIIDRIREEGLSINKVLNQSTPVNRKAYVNRGAELAMNFRRIITDKVLNLANLSPKLKRQMTERLFFYKDGKVQLESKQEFRARRGYSPDNFDAAILAHAGCNIYVFQAASKEAAKAAEPGLNHSSMAHYRRHIEEIYGRIDNHRANTGRWRTSGISRGRHIGNKVPGFTR